jgi:hypothetical protein
MIRFYNISLSTRDSLRLAQLKFIHTQSKSYSSKSSHDKKFNPNIEESTSTANNINKNSISNSKFENSIFLPSTTLSSILFDYKLKISKISKPYTISNFNLIKELVEKLDKESDSVRKFQQLLSKFEPVIVDVLLDLSNDQFVNLYLLICSKGYKLNNFQIIDRIKYILIEGKFIDRYKLLTSDITAKEVKISDIRNPLTPVQKNIISNTYSIEILKFIITDIYGEFEDRFKINEFLELIKRSNNNNSNNTLDSHNIQRFENFIHFYYFNQSIDLGFHTNSSIIFIINSLGSYLNQHLEIPPKFVDKFHEYIIARYPSFNNTNTLINYIQTMYEKLPKELTSLVEYKAIYSPRGLLSEHLSPIMKQSDIPGSILSLFFSRYLSIVDDNKIKNLLEDFKQINVDDEISKHFKIALFNHANKIFDRNPKFSQYLIKFVKNKNESFALPEYAKMNIKNSFQYYNGNFEAFLNYISASKKYASQSFDISTEEVIWIFQQLNETEKKRLINTLVENNCKLDDSSFLMTWIDSTPTNVSSILINKNKKITSSDENSIVPLQKAILFFTPHEILKIISKHGDQITNSKPILMFLKPFNDDFEYYCAKINVSSIISNGKDLKTIIDLFTKFLQNNDLCDSNFNSKMSLQQQSKLYIIFIQKLMRINQFYGAILACSLIPSFKNILVNFSGISESYFYKIPDGLVIHENIPFKNELIYDYVRQYCSYTTNFKLFLSLFKSTLRYGFEIEDKVERDAFNNSMLEYFQNQCILRKFNVLTLCRIWQLAEMFKLDSVGKINFNFGKYIEDFYSVSENLEKDENILLETFIILSKYESSIDLSPKIIEKIFLKIPDKDKLFFIVNLRNTLTTVPYVTIIDKFIHQLFLSSPIEIYKLFGLEIENPLCSNPKSKRPKWTRFDARYFSPLIEKAMKDVIDKESNLSFRQMFTDSLALMKQDNNFVEALEFYEIYHKVTLFDKNLNETIRSNNLFDFISEFNQVLKLENGKKNIPEYIYQPFIFHFLYTRIFSYDLKTMVQMIYLTTNKNELLGKLGFWNIIQSENIDYEVNLNNINEHFKITEESHLMNLYRILFTSSKNVNEISATELTYIVELSENLIKYEKVSKRNKYMIMNCVFILVGKHSDLLSTFYKKMRLILPDYKVSNTIMDELLYSTITNDLRDIDMILDNLIDSHDSQTLNQSFETVIKRLIKEEQNSLAQELYLKYTERKPRFRINDLPDGFSFSRAKQPIISIDSNEGVNMKMDKYKIKLYDYESLDKQKLNDNK